MPIKEKIVSVYLIIKKTVLGEIVRKNILNTIGHSPERWKDLINQLLLKMLLMNTDVLTR